MRFILLAVSLFFASNTYAAVINNLYIFHDDSDKRKLGKEEYRKAKIGMAEYALTAFKNDRKINYHSFAKFAKNEVVYRAGDINKKDVSAKIGMTKDQVIKSYWGKPDDIYKTTEGDDKLELWVYEIHGERSGISKMDAKLYFINGKLTHRISEFPVFQLGK